MSVRAAVVTLLLASSCYAFVINTPRHANLLHVLNSNTGHSESVSVLEKANTSTHTQQLATYQQVFVYAFFCQNSRLMWS